MNIVKLLLLVLIVGTGIMFAFLNPGNIMLNYGVGHGEFPVSYVFGAVLIAGVLLGYLAASLSILKWRTAAHRWKSKAESALAEVNNLRRLPLKNQ